MSEWTEPSSKLSKKRVFNCVDINAVSRTTNASGLSLDTRSSVNEDSRPTPCQPQVMNAKHGTQSPQSLGQSQCVVIDVGCPALTGWLPTAA